MTKKTSVSDKQFTSPKAQDAAPKPVEEVKEYPFATFTCELPSMGLVYPVNHPLHNKKVVEMKYMTAKEEDILTSPSLLRSGKAINRVIQSCLLEKVDPDTLLVGDRNALLIALRVSGYGPEYKVSIMSPQSGEQFEHTFDLSNMEINYLSHKVGTRYRHQKRIYIYTCSYLEDSF